ncbi:MAG: hypothetical protein HQ595_04085, partial [Candidatus Omnitrophica bacterium]|nr:hypothetical protein [Candidatus Omnitrophota bacterium]
TDPNHAEIAQKENEDGVKIVQSDDYGVVLELTTSSFQVENKFAEGEQYQLIKLSYPHGQTDQAGQPQVPVKGVLLGVPPRASMSVEVLDTEEQTLTGYNLYPTPRIHQTRGSSRKSWRRNRNLFGPATHQFVKDSSFYAQDQFYPDCLAEVAPAGALRRQDVAKLKIYPLQFNAATGELKLYKKIRIEVDFGRVAELNWGAAYEPWTAFNTLSQGMLRNYGEAKWWRRRHKKKHKHSFKYNRQPTYKIAVGEEGIYRITRQDLIDAGFNTRRLNPRKIKLHNQGKEIPIYVSGERDGRFNRKDYIEFYAQSLHNRYTSTNIYWLSAGPGRGKRMKSKPHRRIRVSSTPSSFFAEAHHEKDEVYWMDIADTGEVDDHWFFADTLRAPCALDFTIPLESPEDVDKQATIELALQGISYGYNGPDHHVRTYLNGQIIDDVYWEGNTECVRQLSIPQSYLAPGENIVSLELPGDTGAEADIVVVNWFKIHYWRQFRAQENLLKFKHQGRGRYLFKVTNLSEKKIKVFDITDPQNVQRIVKFNVDWEGSGYVARFKQRFKTEDQRSYLVVSGSAVKSPLSIIKDQPSQLKSDQNQADYIIITPQDFYSEILPLAQHRRLGGFKVQVVKVEDIYDEFNFGIFSPQAIKDFLSFTYSQWPQPSPIHVLLVGDATYDYQDNEGLGLENLVPTHLVHSLSFGETACDNWFVCLDGEDDILPDMFIGRFPVYTLEQLNTMVNKIINYENSSSDGWTKQITLVADNLENEFAQLSERLVNYLPAEY